jgi:predicted histone-like DNA-binding protein
MAIKYKVVEKGEPGGVGGGVKKFYAQIVLDGEMTIDEITKTIEKFSALSESDIRGVIIAVENVIQDALAAGKIIRLEKIGSLYPAISSQGEDDALKVSKASIKKVKVNYRPGSRLNKVLTSADFTKVSD